MAHVTRSVPASAPVKRRDGAVRRDAFDDVLVGPINGTVDLDEAARMAHPDIGEKARAGDALPHRLFLFLFDVDVEQPPLAFRWMAPKCPGSEEVGKSIGVAIRHQ